MSKYILLTKDKRTKVDDEDYGWLSQWRWYAIKMRSGWRAIRNECKGKKSNLIIMARFILNAPKGMDVDHINGDTLDNRRSNLRVCTHQQNCQNRKPNKKGASKYKGVKRQRKRWSAIVKTNGKNIFIGEYDTEIEAAKAYDNKAKELFGEYAWLNFE